MAIIDTTEGYVKIPDSLESPRHDVEKGESQMYGTFVASKSKNESGETIITPQGLSGRVWLSLGAAMTVVATMALFAFVLASVFL